MTIPTKVNTSLFRPTFISTNYLPSLFNEKSDHNEGHAKNPA